MSSSPAFRYFALHAGLPLLLAFALLAIVEGSDVDLRFQALFYDGALHRFPYRINWFLEDVIHDFGRLLVVVAGSACLIAFLASFRAQRLAPWRWNLLFCALTIALGPIVVAQIKHSTVIHCPNDLIQFGGDVPYLRLLAPIPPGIEYGHCWPGGHSSGGFSIMTTYFGFRVRAPRLARGLLVGGFVYGNLLGIGRVVQGSHFLSHQLWAALICWFVALVLYEALLRHRLS